MCNRFNFHTTVHFVCWSELVTIPASRTSTADETNRQRLYSSLVWIYISNMKKNQDSGKHQAHWTALSSPFCVKGDAFTTQQQSQFLMRVLEFTTSPENESRTRQRAYSYVIQYSWFQNTRTWLHWKRCVFGVFLAKNRFRCVCRTPSKKGMKKRVARTWGLS